MTAGTHPHEHSGGTTAPPSHGSGGLTGLMLDIGQDIGALVVRADARYTDLEIEVSSPEVHGGRRVHAVVRPHRAGDATEHAAVFVELATGTYTVWSPEGGATWGRVRIEGGAIAELDARTTAALS